MNPKFACLTESLEPSFQRLIACPPHTGRGGLPRGLPKRAVYLFSEGGEHFYVGRTNRLRARHREHMSGRNNDAPFAFKLARKATCDRVIGKLTRAQLELHPLFTSAFEEARKRVERMEFRWVEEADPNRQCLLEIYATIVLGAHYNDFENH
jgi:hypothetical protein